MGGRPRLLDREQVVEAALDLLEQQGYHGLSMRRLAGELLVSLPTVYAVIGSRARLLVDVLDAALQRSPIAGLGRDPTAVQLQVAYDWFEARPWLLAAVTELRPLERRELWVARPGFDGQRAGVIVHVVDLVARLVEDGLAARDDAGVAMAALLRHL